jgi:MFS family permease
LFASFLLLQVQCLVLSSCSVLFASFLFYIPLAFSCNQATGLLFINNASFIARALRRDDLASTIPIVWPLASVASRLAIGYISDVFARTVSRGFLLAVFALAMCAAFVILTVAMEQLVLCAVIVGCCFGASWCLTPLIIGEEFGAAEFGVNWFVHAFFCCACVYDACTFVCVCKKNVCTYGRTDQN